jgi:class 3 adenylate cyclase
LRVFTFTGYLFSTRPSRTEAQASEGDGDGEAHQRCFVAIPSNVRDRILKDAEEQAERDMLNKKGFFGAAPKNRLKTFLDEDNVAEAQAFDTKPIADLFPHTTVMFGIFGFTAWSSVREPSQVFTLLETVYHAFDEIAKRRVFKVETIGDCYVAVCGLPDPRKDHAVVMARFARLL